MDIGNISSAISSVNAATEMADLKTITEIQTKVIELQEQIERMNSSGTTIFLTIFAGVSVYVLGQMAMMFLIQPFNRQRTTISEIADFLIFYANQYTNPGLKLDNEKRRAQLEEVRLKARSLASALIVRTQAIPTYKLLAKFRMTRKLSQIREAYGGLIFISNNLYEEGGAIKNYEMSKNIATALGISTELRAEQ